MRQRIKPTSKAFGIFRISARPVSLSAIKCLTNLDLIRKSVVFTLLLSLCLSPLAGLNSAYASASAKAPRVTGMRLQQLTSPEGTPPQIPIVLEITGEGFGNPPKILSVNLINETGVETVTTVTTANDRRIVAISRMPLGKYTIRLSINGLDVDTSSYSIDLKMDDRTPTADDAAAQDAQNPLAPIKLTYQTFKSQQYPNLYSLLITNQNATSNKAGFSTNPNYMKVDIIPAGATNITVQPGSSPRQMMVTFVAPDAFEVKGVLVTVYDPSSTLSSGEPIAFATSFEEEIEDDVVVAPSLGVEGPATKSSAKKAAEQLKITNVDILSLQRRTGIGRLKIEGQGFGHHADMPITGERELLCCLNRPQITFERNRTPGDNQNRDEVSDLEVCGAVRGTNLCAEMAAWRKTIENDVHVTLVPRNPDLRVERTQIMYINDNLIEVYFEFTHYPGYSEPFRLQGVSVSVTKNGVRTAHASDKKGTVTGTVTGPQTFIASHDIGLKRDKNLEYRYTVLEQNDANLLFGKGVGERFYVVQLSIVNNGEKKVAVPLSSIQAEIEWAYGDGPRGSDLIYEEGPATISPLPLSAISGYFDNYNKSSGKRAKVFNALSGLTTLMTALIPVFGPGFREANGIFATGLIPGLRLGLGDLTSQQLQNLTSMSWENIEEVPAGGGKNKFIYIQRGDQLYGLKGDSALTTVKKKIMNIRGLEVSGFEILESEKKSASPQQ
ncbi:MAG: hypothetical protein WCF57_23630 [Pyrinomonadaceae bacterium]